MFRELLLLRDFVGLGKINGSILCYLNVLDGRHLTFISDY